MPELGETKLLRAFVAQIHPLFFGIVTGCKATNVEPNSAIDIPVFQNKRIDFESNVKEKIEIKSLCNWEEYDRVWSCLRKSR